MGKKNKPQSMSDHITRFMSMLDSQVAREMQRSPAEREEHGVQKWEPFQKRVEQIVAHVVGALGEEQLTLDAILICAEAYPRILRLLVEEFGERGLGKVRSDYCREIFSRIDRDLHHAKDALGGTSELN